MWMQGKHADDIIRIRVVPTTIRRSVIDGQQLNELHARSHSPVHKTLEVAKIAHAVGVLATQREHRNGHTSCPPRFFGQPQMTTIKHQHLSVRNLVCISIDRIDGHKAVFALFPSYQFVGLTIHHHIFIFYRHEPTLGIDRQHPLAITRILHRQIATGVPRPDSGVRTTDSHQLSWH